MQNVLPLHGIKAIITPTTTGVSPWQWSVVPEHVVVLKQKVSPTSALDGYHMKHSTWGTQCPMNLVSSPFYVTAEFALQTNNSSAATHFLHPIPILFHVFVTTQSPPSVLPTSAEQHRGTLPDQSSRHAATHCSWPVALQESKNFGQNNSPCRSQQFRYRTDQGTAF